MISKHDLPGRTWIVAALAVLAAGALAGCGSGGGATGPSSSPAAAARGAGDGGNAGGTGPGGGQPAPGAFERVAAVSPGSLEVQDPSTGQTTVTYTSGTKISQTVSVPEAAVKAGECVTAVAAPPSGSGGSGAASPSNAPTGAPRTLTATTVAISQPVNGSCARGFGGGNRPSGSATFPRPSGTRTRTPGSFGRGFGGAVTGKVTSVSATAIVVQANDRQSNTTVADTVEVTAATRFTETQAATSRALQVGVCVTAIGPTSANGSVSASRIAVSPAVSGSCSFGFGRARGTDA